MAYKQELLEKYHRILFQDKSPIRKYSAYVSFINLLGKPKRNLLSPFTFLHFVKYAIKELTYAKIYRIKSSSLWK